MKRLRAWLAERRTGEPYETKTPKIGRTETISHLEHLADEIRTRVIPAMTEDETIEVFVEDLTAIENAIDILKEETE